MLHPHWIAYAVLIVGPLVPGQSGQAPTRKRPVPDTRRYLPVNPASREYYLALSTGTAVTAAEAISVSDVAFGTGKVNTWPVSADSYRLTK